MRGLTPFKTIFQRFGRVHFARRSSLWWTSIGSSAAQYLREFLNCLHDPSVLRQPQAALRRVFPALASRGIRQQFAPLHHRSGKCRLLPHGRRPAPRLRPHEEPARSPTGQLGQGRVPIVGTDSARPGVCLSETMAHDVGVPARQSESLEPGPSGPKGW